MSDLVAFLKARIAEDEQLAREALAPHPHTGAQVFYDRHGRHVDDWVCNTFHVPVDRFLAECRVKRAIIALHPVQHCYVSEQRRSEADPQWFYAGPAYSDELLILALVYCDHPDYDPAWAPR